MAQKCLSFALLVRFFLKFLLHVTILLLFFYQSQSCIYVKDLMEDIPDDVDLQNSPGKLSSVLK